MSDTIQEGQVVSMEYSLQVDGKVVDSSDGDEPLEFLVGFDNIIEGLEDEMLSMKVGESKKVIVSPEDGYGEYDDEAFMDVPRSEFPADMPVKPGLEMEVTDEEGNPMYARIEAVKGDQITLNFNHPLAGKELHFSVKVLSIRDATEEELEHGHAHTNGGHHH